jgi:hypothetical protein
MLAEFGLFDLALIAIWVYGIFDCIRTDDSLVQNLPKMVWLFIVFLFPGIGSIAWLLLGRPPRGEWRLRTTGVAQRPPDDMPSPGLPERPATPSDHAAKREEALRRYNEEREAELKRKEADLRRREEELRKREEGSGA